MRELEELPIPLLIWYNENARTLPWRTNPTPYGVWVSEIMLQQTRVVAVLEYYRRFLEELPTVEDLAHCPEERLMKLWQGLGYYSRVRNLQKAARQIMDEFGGVFPNKFEDILSLCGVGDYTAGAISSIAFGLPHPAVDGNVLRVVARITGDDGDITTTLMKKRVTTALYEYMPMRQSGDFNQGMMELGATVCLPNGAPLCDRCPACLFCVAHGTDRTGELPVKTKKKGRRLEHRVVLLLFCQGRVVLHKRGEKGLLAGLWEYPNALGTVEEMVDNLDISVELVPILTGKHIFTHIEWHMSGFVGQIAEANLPADWILASREEVANRYAIPNAFSIFGDAVSEGLGYF